MLPTKKFGAFKKSVKTNFLASNQTNASSIRESSRPNVISGFEEEEQVVEVVSQAISGYDGRNAIPVEKPIVVSPKKPLVIPFEESHRSFKKKLYRPDLGGRAPTDGEIILMESTSDAKKVVPGLIKTEKKIEIQVEPNSSIVSSTSVIKVKEVVENDGVEKLEDLAVQMLIAESNGDVYVDPGKINVIKIEASELSLDINQCPESGTLEDYEEVPVEGFGEALLRGMGWEEGVTVGKRRYKEEAQAEVKRRPKLLGLGAKPKPKFLEEKHSRKP